MASYLLLIPSVVPSSSTRCLVSFFNPNNVLIIDNTEINRGVAASWNIGIDKVLEQNRDWLIICSESVTFGPRGGREFIEALDYYKNEDIIEAGNGLGWHLIAFNARTLRDVGYFDEMFYPAYYEDNDYSHRYQLIREVGVGYPGGRDEYAKDFPGKPLWPKVDVDANLEGTAQGIIKTEIKIDFVDLENKYKQKWGGVSPNEKYSLPYNDPLLTPRYAQRNKI